MTTFDAEARYRVDGWPGIAFWIAAGPLDGYVLAVMVGDDKRHYVPVTDLTKLDDLDYCGVCGQIGCGHDGRQR